MKSFLITSISFVLILSGYGQDLTKPYVKDLCGDSINSQQIEGVRYVNKEYFKYFSVLIRDTCNPTNRFTNCYIENSIKCSNEFYFNALLIDTERVVKTELFLKGWLDSIPRSKQKSFHFFNKNLYKKYIKLYGGCIDEKGIEYQVIQFLTKKEFKKNPSYKVMFNLFAIRKSDKLRFMVLKKENGILYMHSYSL